MLLLIETIIYWIITTLIIIYIYIKFYIYDYWKHHGIPHEKPDVPLGNISHSYMFGKIGLGDVLLKTYNKFKQYPFHGFYVGLQPVLILNDPQLIRTIFNKEFTSFYNRGWFSNKKLDPLSYNSFLMDNSKNWKFTRNKLSNAFTPAKLRETFSLIMDVSNELIMACDKEFEINNSLDAKSISKRFLMDIIASTVYRLQTNSLKNPKNDFNRIGKRALQWGNIKMVFGIFIPKILEILRMSFYHKEVIKYYMDIFKNAVEHQHNHPIIRNDFMKVFLEMIEDDTLETDQKIPINDQSNLEEKQRINVQDAAAHAFLFFIAGYETSSVTMSYCLYEMTLNKDIQKRLQDEIDEVAKTSSGFTYDSIAKMEYLDMVIRETIRKYPPVQFLNRICNKDYLIPESNYTIPKGMRIVISSTGIYQNPEFFEDPRKFDPERYNRNNPDNKRNFVDLTFGEGPRNCIGKRLAVIQIKIGIVQMLHKYNISLSDNTIYKSETNTGSFLQEMEDFRLHLERR